jgi:hypothetical protein
MSYALRRLTVEQFGDWLATHGVNPDAAKQVVSGFDLNKPLIEEFFEIGDRLFQYIRGSSAGVLAPLRGNWFARAGASLDQLAILEGVAGRRLHRFSVIASFSSVEGTAAKFGRNVLKDLGGAGGASQIFVPHMYCGRVRAVGGQERW